MSHHDAYRMAPSLEALHAARSALTVAGGRIALAQRHIARGDEMDRVASDLEVVPAHLGQIAAAVDRLAQAAMACERSDPFTALETNDPDR